MTQKPDNPPNIEVYTGLEYGKTDEFVVLFRGFQNLQQCDDFLKLLQHHGIARHDITRIGSNIH